MTVLRGFIAGANAQYRAAGLDQYQLHVDRSGKVTAPGAPAPRFKPVPGTGSAAPDQASSGAAGATTTSSGASPTAAQPSRSGAAPKLTALTPTADGFAMRWNAVSGARRYGIYVDGALVGHVTKPAFDGKLTAGSGGVVQVDAVRANGSRTALTPAVRLDRDSTGKLVASDPTAPAPAATAGAADPTGTAAGSATAAAAAPS